MKSVRVVLLASIAALAHLSVIAQAQHGHGSHSAQSVSLTEAQLKFLVDYEEIRAALAADDLPTAKRAAANIPDSPAAVQLTKAPSLNEARMAFKKLSTQAVTFAKGQVGYYVVHCHMVGSDWVQRTTKITNPYLGAKMSNCGSVQN